VCVDWRMENARVDTILSDNWQGAYDAVAHLVDLSHERIGFIRGIAHISTLTERREGCEQALQDLVGSGPTADDDRSARVRDWASRGGDFAGAARRLDAPVHLDRLIPRPQTVC
jgi:DNA-binding LacI/PurR family transcriptional regulator